MTIRVGKLKFKNHNVKNDDLKCEFYKSSRDDFKSHNSKLCNFIISKNSSTDR